MGALGTVGRVLECGHSHRAGDVAAPGPTSIGPNRRRAGPRIDPEVTVAAAHEHIRMLVNPGIVPDGGQSYRGARVRKTGRLAQVGKFPLVPLRVLLDPPFLPEVTVGAV